MVKRTTEATIEPKVLYLCDSNSYFLSLKDLFNEIKAEVVLVAAEKEFYKVFTTDEYATIIVHLTLSDDKSYDIAKKISRKFISERIPIILILNRPIQVDLEKYELIDFVYMPLSILLLSLKIKLFISTFVLQKEKLEKLDKEIRHAEIEIKGKDTKISLPMDDNLTGLMNSYALRRTAKYIISSSLRYKRTLSLILFTIDNNTYDLQSKYNDKTRDTLLKKVAIRLKRIMRNEDLIARQGFLFALLLSDLNEYDDVIEVVNKFNGIFEESYNFDKYIIRINLSIGVAFLGDSIDSFDSLIDVANIAMQKASASPGTACEVYTDNLFKTDESSNSIVRKFSAALHNDEFHLVFQPIVDMQQNKIIGLETLLRWNNDELGLVSPGVFIPLAEDNDIFYEVGLWILEKVCEQINIWKKCRFVDDLYITVNISDKQLENENFKDDLCSILIKYNITPIHIELELVDLSYPPSSSNNSKSLSLKQAQIHLSLDDFNVNSATLARLMARPVSTVKINGKLVQRIQNGVKEQTLVKTIIGSASNLFIQVLAECVETEEQKDFLIKNGCTLGQGYFFYKPMEAEEITMVLNKHLYHDVT